jgi:hypothetical protein
MIMNKEDNVGSDARSFRERYADYWKGCCDVLREEPIKEYHGVVMSSDPPEVEPMSLDPVAEASILTQFSNDTDFCKDLYEASVRAIPVPPEMITPDENTAYHLNHILDVIRACATKEERDE